MPSDTGWIHNSHHLVYINHLNFLAQHETKERLLLLASIPESVHPGTPPTSILRISAQIPKITVRNIRNASML